MSELRLLILNAGWAEIPLIQEAKKLGAYVITTGNRPDLSGHKLSDKYVSGDYSNNDQMLEIVETNNITNVISCAHDFGYITAARISELKGWKGYDSYETTLALHRKDSIKNILTELEIGTPKGKTFTEREVALRYLEKQEYPLMIKSVDQAAGVGVSKVNNHNEAVDAIDYAFNESRSKSLIIEEYIKGRQQSYVAFIVNQHVICDMSCDCYSQINPYWIQTETMPGEGFSEYQDTLKQYVENIANRLELVDGILTLQYFVKDGEIYVIEMMRRCLGNQFLEPVSKITGFPWYKGLLMAELGMDCGKLKSTPNNVKYAGWHGIMTQNEGVVSRIVIPRDIQDYLYKTGEIYSEGTEVKNHLKEKLGYLYYTYESKEELESVPIEYNERIKVEFYDE